MLLIVLLLLGLIAFWLLPQSAAAMDMGDIAVALFGRPSLTGRHRILHRRLAVMYPQHVIFAQVALSELTNIIPGAPEHLSIHGHFKGRVADFVLCRRDFHIVAVIELDDASCAPPRESHAHGSMGEDPAALRLVRIGSGPIPSQSQLQQILGEKMQPGVPVLHG